MEQGFEHGLDTNPENNFSTFLTEEADFDEGDEQFLENFPDEFSGDSYSGATFSDNFDDSLFGEDFDESDDYGEVMPSSNSENTDDLFGEDFDEGEGEGGGESESLSSIEYYDEEDFSEARSSSGLFESVPENQENDFGEEDRQFLLSNGYIFTDGLTRDQLKSLKSRLFQNEEEENSVLERDADLSVGTLSNIISEVSSSQATYIPERNGYEFLKNIGGSTVGGFLGAELSADINKWIDESVREDQDISDDEISSQYLKTHKSQLGNDFDEQYLYHYVRETSPIIRSNLTNELKQIQDDRKRRNKIAITLNYNEYTHLQALAYVERYRLIRQIKVSPDNSFTTKCPYCGKEISVTAPILSIIVYGKESRNEKSYIPRAIICECKTAIYFRKTEYDNLYRHYLNVTQKSMSSFINEALTYSGGASELTCMLPIGSMREIMPELFIGDPSESVVVASEEKSYNSSIVSDADFLEAARQFYFKLEGFGNRRAVITTPQSNKKAKKSTYTDPGLKSLLAMAGIDSEVSEDLSEESSSKQDYSNEEITNPPWTYQSAAVYVCQGISKNYYVEHKRALFSLIFTLSSNPYFGNYLRSSLVFDADNTITFLNDLRNTKIPYHKKKIVEMLLTNYKFNYSGELEDNIENAIKHVQKVKDKGTEDRKFILGKLKENQEKLSFTKMMRISLYKAGDLRDFLDDEELATILNEIADRMILKTYAGEFFQYWSAFNVIRPDQINKIFNTCADMEEAEKRLSRRLTALDLPVGEIIGKMHSVHHRDGNYEAMLVRLNRAFMNVDYYQFSAVLSEMLSYSDNKDYSILNDLEALDNNECQKVVSMSPAEFYLTDFTADEIASYPDCNNIMFGRYIPIRKPGETIKTYCERFSEAQSSGKYSECRDNLILFEKFRSLWVELSFCSVIPDSEFKSRGKSLFMDALLCSFVNRKADKIDTILGVTLMHANIIQTIKPDPIIFKGFGTEYRLLHGIYFSAVRRVMDATNETFDLTHVTVNDSTEDILRKSTCMDVLRDILGGGVQLDEDEIMEDVDNELLMYFGGSFKDLISWAGVRE